MMDCTTASKLIMKYLDGEATDFEKKLLYEHVNDCKTCGLEFKALTDTFSALNSVKMEEPPEALEESVITKIIAEDRSREKTRLYILAAAFIISGWAALMSIFKYTPLVDVIVNSFNSILSFIRDLAPIAGSIVYRSFTEVLKLFVIERAVREAGSAIMWAYSPVLTVVIILMAVILLLYDYMFKLIGR